MRSPQLRVLFLNDTARNGGPGRSLAYLLRFLDPAVVHRTVVLPRPGVVGELLLATRACDALLYEPHLVENPVEPLSRAMVRADFDAPAPLRALRLGANMGKGVSAVLRVASLVRRGGYDLVYCNGTNADFFGAFAARLAGVHALWHVRYTSVPAAVRPLHERLAAHRSVARIVCVSKAAAALFPHAEDKVRVIHNALDPDEWRDVTPVLRHRLELPDGAVVFGSQGRILPRKGYVELIRATDAALRALSPEERPRLHVVIVGDTPEDIRPDHLAECQALARQLGLGAQVHFTGFVDDVRPWVRDFDVTVVPSVYPDPLPRAVIEGMALGKPVLAFDVGGVAEMLEDGTVGTLVAGPRGETPADVDGLAAQIVRYFRDRELRERQGRAARARIERDFDAREHGRRIQEEIVLAAGRS